MIIICEECGQKYRIDPERISGKGVRVKCKACGNMMPIIPPQKVFFSNTTRTSKQEDFAMIQTAPKTKAKKKTKINAVNTSSENGKGLGVRAKMFLLFFLLPLVLIIAASFMFIWQMSNFASLYHKVSKQIIQSMAEEAIAAKSKDVAREIKFFLDNHLELEPEEFYNNPRLRQIGIQNVGKVGYTALYKIPENRHGPWPTLMHPKADLIGKDMKKFVENNKNLLVEFRDIYSKFTKEIQVRSNYQPQGIDDKTRKKFMVCSPVYGTPYLVAATAYMDVFAIPLKMRPLKMLETSAKSLFERTRLFVILTIAGLLIVIALFVSLFSEKLSKNIKSLTDVAERISIGDLEAEVEVRSRDEIGQLAQAISRMQESVRLSIEKMRGRRH